MSSSLSDLTFGVAETEASRPLVSIVIPVFNRADCIADAIRSGLAQEHLDSLEIIVVDDGSTDETVAVVQALARDNLHFVRHPDNRGGAAARNTGLDHARGRYVAFLDSDDVWDADKLTTQLELLQRTADPESTVCHCQLRARSIRSEVVIPRRDMLPGESVADYLFVQDGHLQTSSLLLSLTLARRARFDPALRKHQDYDFCLRLEAIGARFVMVRRPLLIWHHDARPDRITNKFGVEASERFLASRREQMGPQAADAFWVRNIFLRQLRASPLGSLKALGRRIRHGPLPINWYLRWFLNGAARNLSRLRRQP